MSMLISLLLSFLIVGCGGDSTSTLQTNSTLTPTLYLSQTSGAFEGGIDERIAEDISLAQESIQLAMYDFTNEKLLDALIQAHQRGVNVRVVTDDSTIESDCYQSLIAEGVAVVDDQNTQSLMHNKFLLIDNHILWMGSTNFTYYAFYRNNEDALRWESSALTLAYGEVFEKLFTHQPTPTHTTLSNLSVYFSPNQESSQAIIDAIESATKRIHFMLYTFTDSRIAQALIQAHQRGVEVLGIFDESQNSYQTYSQYTPLLEAGLSVKLDGNPYKLHHKVMIIDDNLTIIGSYNFTRTAQESNAENLLFVEEASLRENLESAFESSFLEAK